MKRDGQDGKGEDGRALWAQVTQDVTPLRGRSAAPAPSAPVSSSRPRVHRVLPQETAPAASPEPASREIDRRTRQKFERGQMEIEAVLDLHGYGRDTAFEAVRGFIAQGRQAGLRCVLIITGKGRGGREGVLKASLAGWLEEPALRSLILDVAPARAKHGGGGAFYVLLRRVRV